MTSRSMEEEPRPSPAEIQLGRDAAQLVVELVERLDQRPSVALVVETMPELGPLVARARAIRTVALLVAACVGGPFANPETPHGG